MSVGAPRERNDHEAPGSDESNRASMRAASYAGRNFVAKRAAPAVSSRPVMHAPGDYERLQIESLLQSQSHGGVDGGVGLFLMPRHEHVQVVHDVAVLPAMRKNGLNHVAPVWVFGSDSQLREVARWLRAAHVIVADLTYLNPDVMYVLGLAHGLGRCPILIHHEDTEVPFNLDALRCIEYRPDHDGLLELRARLTRAIRVLLSANN